MLQIHLMYVPSQSVNLFIPSLTIRQRYIGAIVYKLCLYQKPNSPCGQVCARLEFGNSIFVTSSDILRLSRDQPVVWL